MHLRRFLPVFVLFLLIAGTVPLSSPASAASTLVLRPNASTVTWYNPYPGAGWSSNCTGGNVSANIWQCLDEVSPDDNVTFFTLNDTYGAFPSIDFGNWTGPSNAMILTVQGFLDVRLNQTDAPKIGAELFVGGYTGYWCAGYSPIFGTLATSQEYAIKSSAVYTDAGCEDGDGNPLPWNTSVINDTYLYVFTYSGDPPIFTTFTSAWLSVTYSLVPTADIRASPTHTYIGTAVTFNGTLSDGHSYAITNWTWNYGDGTLGYGNVTSHAYSAAGTYIASLRVENGDGLNDTATVSIVVVLPAASVSIPIIFWFLLVIAITLTVVGIAVQSGAILLMGGLAWLFLGVYIGLLSTDWLILAFGILTGGFAVMLLIVAIHLFAGGRV